MSLGMRLADTYTFYGTLIMYIASCIHKCSYVNEPIHAHSCYPPAYPSVFRDHESETYLDQARCMTHVTHAYHLQHENLRTLMAALKQLNAVEEAQEDVHEV